MGGVQLLQWLHLENLLTFTVAYLTTLSAERRLAFSIRTFSSYYVTHSPIKAVALILAVVSPSPTFAC